MRACVAMFALCACAHGVQPGSLDAQAVADTEAAWRAAGLPWPGDCLDGTEVIRHDTRRDFDDACASFWPGLYRAESVPAGCLTSSPKTGWIVNIAPGYHDDPTIIGHELRHALVYCHLDRPRTDPFDAGHTDTRVWR